MIDLKPDLDGDELFLGAGVFLPSADVVEILSYHLDWLVVDLEHGAIDVGDLPDVIRAAERWETAVFVRVDGTGEGDVDRILDAGADGIVYPHVQSADDAAACVERTFYPPLGDRSVGYGRVQRYGQQKEETALTANDSVVCAIQIEDTTALDNLAEIMAVDGVDAAFVGPNDLAASKHTFREALSDGYDFDIDADVERVAEAAADHDVVFGYPTGDREAVAELRQLGGQLALTKFDASFLNDAVADLVDELEPEL